MNALRAFITTLIIVVVLGIVFLLYSSGLLKKKAADVAGEVKQQVTHAAAEKLDPVIEDAIAAGLQEAGVPIGQVGTIMEHVSDEDKEAVTEIVVNHMDAVKDVSDFVQSGDTEALQDYLEDHLSDSEKETLQDLIDKYGSYVNQ